MRQILALAWRNLWRHGRRTLITAVAMAIGVALSMGGLAWTDGTYSMMWRVMIDEAVGHIQVHHSDYPRTRDLFDLIPDGEARVRELERVPEVSRVSGRVYGHALVGGAETSEGAMLVGVMPGPEQAHSGLDQRVSVGRYLGESPEAGILLGWRLAERLGLGVGEEVVAVTQAADGSLGNALYTVVGLVETGSVRLDRSGAYLHLHDLHDLLALDGGLHEIIVRTPDATDRARISAVAEEVEAVFGEQDVVVRPWWVLQPTFAQIAEMQTVSSVIILGVIFALAALGVLNTMLMSVFERTRELGVLKAIGMRPRRVVALVVAESLSLGVLATGIGALLGGLLTWYLVVHGIRFVGPDGRGISIMGVEFDALRGEVNPQSMVMVLAAVVVVAVLAALWPAFRAARLDPVAAMREDA